jgi:exopolysaccharide production protein ExoQ
MPASLATCLFFGFIVMLLYRSMKRGQRSSLGLLVPTVWFALIGSKPLLYWFHGRDYEADLNSYLDGNPIDGNLFLALIVLGIVILAQRRIDWRTTWARNRALGLLYLFLIISVLWSDEPFVSFKRWVKDVGNVVMILVMMTENNPTDAISKVFLRCAYLLIPLSVLTIKWYPDIGRYYHRWTWETCYCGVTTNKNSLGVLAMVSGLALLWSFWEARKRARWLTLLRSSWAEVIVLVMCIWILAIAHSQSALMCFAIGTVTLLVLCSSRIQARVGAVLWIGCIATLFMVALTAAPDLRAVVAQALGRDVTFTGRIDIWEAVLQLNTNPLIGTGFASVWLTPGGRSLAEELGIPHAHNGYLETYLNSGLIGLVLLLAIIIAAGRKTLAQVAAGTAIGPFNAALLLSGLVYNYTEATFNNNNIVGFSIWLTAVAICRHEHVKGENRDNTVMFFSPHAPRQFKSLF